MARWGTGFLLLSQSWEVVPASEQGQPERSELRDAALEAHFMLSRKEDVQISSYWI